MWTLRNISPVRATIIMTGNINRGIIFFVETNVYGAVVIYGAYGVKQYYGYTKAEAKKKYLESDHIFTNQKRG